MLNMSIAKAKKMRSIHSFSSQESGRITHLSPFSALGGYTRYEYNDCQAEKKTDRSEVI